ncbi:MAG TPA: response regulator [Chitinophagaceae bacterium]|nr:response regulator [Chitinophagaceae bacterium]
MSRTVLSINGNKSMNYMLQTVLSRKYKITTVADVFQGMQHLKNNESIELVVVDVDFNGEESWEFIQHIKSSWMYNRPVIVLTSNKQASENAKAEAGVDYFFQKPFSPIDLIKTIDALLYAPTAYSV